MMDDITVVNNDKYCFGCGRKNVTSKEKIGDYCPDCGEQLISYYRECPKYGVISNLFTYHYHRQLLFRETTMTSHLQLCPNCDEDIVKTAEEKINYGNN